METHTTHGSRTGTQTCPSFFWPSASRHVSLTVNTHSCATVVHGHGGPCFSSLPISKGTHGFPTAMGASTVMDWTQGTPPSQSMPAAREWSVLHSPFQSSASTSNGVCCALSASEHFAAAAVHFVEGTHSVFEGVHPHEGHVCVIGPRSE